MTSPAIISITGGTGFVGRAICAHPLLREHRIRILTRNAAVQNLSDNIGLIEGDAFDDDTLDRLMKDSSAHINLVGILNECGHDGSEFERIHAQLPKVLAEACVRNNVGRMIQMSALNADADKGTSYYLRSKGRGEDAVHALESSNFKVTSFRPSVIFGKEDSFVNRFAGLLKFAPIMPLACPNARFAPIHVSDVADRFVSALDDESTVGNRINLCGPKDYSLLDLVKYIARAAGRRRLIIPLPDLASRLQANVFEYLPGKPFSVDNYHSLQMDSICKQGERATTSLESVVPGYIR